MKKSISRNILSLALCAALVLILLPTVALADSAVYRYIDENGAEKTTSGSVTVIDSSWTGARTLTAGWYAVSGTVDTDNLTVDGEVHLILTDGAYLTVASSLNSSAGITVNTVNPDNSLTIYAQSMGANMGKLEATSEINSINGAGIGGNAGQSAGTITINGGWITANGGDGGGAGIGGGGNGGEGGTVTINGGVVTAYNSAGGAGIGGGQSNNGGTVTITGGTVNATGGNNGGAGIGGGGSVSSGGSGGTVTISGGTVNATGGGFSRNDQGSGGAGIGGGYQGSGGTVTISGGTVNATGGNADAEDIGKGAGGADSGTLQNNSTEKTPVSLTTVTLSGVTAKTAVSSLTTNAGYSYGINDMYTDSNGRLYLYLPVSTVTSAATAASANYAGSVTTTTDPATSLGILILEMADLTVTITDGVITTAPGGSVTYTITAANAGPSDVMGATVDCTLPAALTASWTAVGAGGGTATAFGSGNINDTVNLPAGGSVTYTVTASIDSAVMGTLSTTATISAPSGIVDPNTANNSATDTDTLISADASLSNLNISQGALSPSFDGSTYSYSASVANIVTSLTVTPTANGANATITVNGTAVTSAAASGDIPLSVGANTVQIIVTAQDGTTTQTYYITVTRAQSSGWVIINEPDYKADVSSGGTLDVNVDKASGNAAVTAGDNLGAGILDGGDETVVVPSIPGVTSYTLGIPLAYLTTPSGGSLTFRTDTGSIRLPADMLSVLSGTQGEKAEITIGAGDKSGLSEEEKTAIGDRPLIELSLTLDGVQTDWSNPGAPVTVSIPYTPTTEELQNPDAIIIWYLDGNGNPSCVPSGRYDAASGTVTFTTTHFSIYAVAYNDVEFSDVSGWYKDYVDFVSARDIMTGTDLDSFSPDGTMTRAMVVTVLNRLSGDTGSYTNKFADVDSGSWYEKEVAWAAENSIVSGVGNNQFSPESAVTREQLAVMLYNYVKYMEYDVSVGEDTNILSYNDALTISEYAYPALQWACGAGIIKGDNNGNLNPKNTATRAEVAAMLERFIKSAALD